jgi:hypothetical protein
MNHEEDKLASMRDELPALLDKDQGNDSRWDYLGYPVQFPIQSNNNTMRIQSNNNTMRPRIIYNMRFT